MKDEIRYLGRRVKDGEISWKEASKEYNNENGTNLSSEALRARYRYLDDDYEPNTKLQGGKDFETTYVDCSI